ncbi:MAG TPA: nuclear transport factor 2 family protein [Thermomonas sp.]|nr:nuclear transport factor 2 family protein [Thermomonas sp.]
MQQIRGFQRYAASLAIATVLLLAGCGKDSPEQAVRAQVDALQAAIDARDAGDIEDLLAEDFVGNDGLDRRGARQLAAGVFLRHREVAAKVGPVSVEVRGTGDAIARFSVLATGGSGGLLPEQGQLYQLETGWRLADGEWKLVNASWTPAGI